MFNCYQRIIADKSYAVGWAVISFFIIAIAALIGVISFATIIGGAVEDSSGYGQNVITVEGYGEVDATPDIATLSFSVEETASTVEQAQEAATKKMNDTLAYLEDQDIDEEDIKTTGYNAYPKYEWVQEICVAGTVCPPGKSTQVGFTVSQNVSIKIRDIDNAGTVLAGIGKTGVTNISGLSFGIDDDAGLREEAQKLAIQDAKARAKRLAKELGVKLDDLVNFYEQSGGYPEPYMMRSEAMGLGGASDAAMAVPELPAGENTISSRVSVTYEIK